MDKTTKSAILIFCLLGLIYLITAKGFIEISDTHFSILTAESIIEKGSLAIDEHTGGYCFESRDGKYYSKYGIGLAVIFIPFILASKLIAHISAAPKEFIVNFLVSFYNIFFGAGAAAIFFRMLYKKFYVPLKTAVIMAFVLGLATMQWRYSIWTFSEVTQGFFLILSVYLTLKNTKNSLLAAGTSYAFLILIGTINLIYAPPFLVYIWLINKENIKRAAAHGLIFLSFILGAICFSLSLNYIRFHDIFEFGYGAEAGMFYLSGIKTNIPKLLYYLDKGIFIYNPILILSVIGYIKIFKDYRREAVFFVSIILSNLIAISMWHMWYGGWCWGPRLLVPTIFLWLFPLYIFISKKCLARYFAVILIFISIAIQILSVLSGNLEYHLICNGNNKEGLRKGMPANIIGSAILLKHKLLKNDNLYKLSEFGIDSDTLIDTSASECYRGLDFWYYYLGRVKKQDSFL
ncbi:MAG: hypothetical protein Q8R38_02475 [Candidatus Omnitrophota bacterium]|nr:hypothetical protein [Candidatus Omnitrophota bacterium]